KPDRSYVTAADTEIERQIRERIADAWPAHGVVGEEFGTERGGGGARRVIRPIRATANFVPGAPVVVRPLAVGSLADRARRGGQAVWGGGGWMRAVGERWWAAGGLGAWAGGTGGRAGDARRIATSSIRDLADVHLLYGELDELTAPDGPTPGFGTLVGDVWRT